MRKIHIKGYGMRNLPIGVGTVQVRCPVTLPYSRDLELCAKSLRLDFEIVDCELEVDTQVLPEPVDAPIDDGREDDIGELKDEDKEILDVMTQLENEADEEPVLPSLTDLSNMRKRDLVDLAAQLGVDFEGGRQDLIDRIRDKQYT